MVPEQYLNCIIFPLRLHSPTYPISRSPTDIINMPAWLHKGSQEMKDYEAVRTLSAWYETRPTDSAG